ncbi:hypothetical protein NIES267_49710 [Calothrix parasitica NIES-267]|uniref:Uncharacterized protein n=1 Tax=Calothrix parasitica NIES-267 TaxID=1973488 RepID=A0A1Z4LWF6_9CYAN|nr:hypothetical protein NIES267_49710 [Calothrix parasitica NIES-267]
MKALQKKISEKFYFVLDEKIAFILNRNLIDIYKDGKWGLGMGDWEILFPVKDYLLLGGRE